MDIEEMVAYAVKFGVSVGRGYGIQKATMDDIVQEACIKIFLFAHKVRRKTWRAWVKKIVVRCTLDYRRSRTSREAKLTEGFDNLYDAMHENDYILRERERIERQERAREMRYALSKLTETYRTTIIAFFYDDLTYKEIAHRFEIPVGTVKSRISSGKRRLNVICHRERLFAYADQEGR